MKKWSHEKGRYSFLHAFLCILVLGAVTLSAYLFASNSVLMREFDQTNQDFLANVVGQVDALLTSADYAVLSWAVNEPDIHAFFETERMEDLSAVTKYQIKRELTDAIVEVKAIYACVSSIHLVNPRSGQVLSEAGSVGLQDFTAQLREAVFCYRSANPTAGVSEIFSSIERDFSQNGAQCIAIIRSYPILGGEELGYIVTTIRIDEIQKTYYDDLTTSSNRACIQIFDQSDVPFHTLDLREGEDEAMPRNVAHTYSQISPQTGWTFRYIRESDAFLWSGNALQTLSLVAMIALLLWTVLVYFVDQTRFFREITGLLHSATKGGVGKELFAQRNLIKTLEGVLNLTTERAERLQKFVREGYPYMAGSLLTNGAVFDKAEKADAHLRIAREYMEVLGADREEIVYAAVCALGLDAQILDQAQKIYRMRGDKNFQSLFTYAPLLLQGHRTLLFVFAQKDVQRNGFALDYFLRQIALFAAQKGKKVAFHKTGFHVSLAELRKDLELFFDASAYRVFADALSDAQPDADESGKGGYPGNTMEQLLQALRKQEGEEVRRCLPQFLADCKKSIAEPYLFYLLWQELAEKSIRAALELGMPLREIEKNDPLRYGREAKNLDDLQQKMLRFYALVLEVRQQKKERTYATAIVRYIDESFCDSELSLASIGEKFGISDSYVSLIIKEKLGIPFVDYLARRRIQRAQELLLNTDMAVADIGRQTGYPNAHTFIRAFKRVTGTSPGKWKSSHLE